MNEEEYSSIQMENGMGVTSLAQENDTLTTKIKQFFKFLGPAVLISVGYVDPGNCKKMDFFVIKTLDYDSNINMFGCCVVFS
ncbi:manganese transport protein MntH [compost metagenome]